MSEKESESEIVDIEALSRAGKTAPNGKHYRIRVDKEHIDVDTQFVTGRRILELAGRLPVERFRLDMKMHGGNTKKVGLDEVVDLAQPGLERFMTIPLDQTEG